MEGANGEREGGDGVKVEYVMEEGGGMQFNFF